MDILTAPGGAGVGGLLGRGLSGTYRCSLGCPAAGRASPPQIPASARRWADGPGLALGGVPAAGWAEATAARVEHAAASEPESGQRPPRRGRDRRCGVEAGRVGWWAAASN